MHVAKRVLLCSLVFTHDFIKQAIAKLRYSLLAWLFFVFRNNN